MDNLILFTSKNCHSCVILKETLMKNDIRFKEVDISSDDGQRLTKKYYIRSIPTLIDEIKLISIVGTYSISDIKKKFQMN